MSQGDMLGPDELTDALLAVQKSQRLQHVQQHKNIHHRHQKVNQSPQHKKVHGMLNASIKLFGSLQTLQIKSRVFIWARIQLLRGCAHGLFVYLHPSPWEG